MKYNDAFLEPAGPVVPVIVRPTGHSVPVETLSGELDTGAAISVIPQSLAIQLRLVPDRSVLMLGYDDTLTERVAYLVDLEIEGFMMESVSVVAVTRDTILLGRDILNHFIITLDGKALTFEMHDP